jgi:hypothetical protein
MGWAETGKTEKRQMILKNGDNTGRGLVTTTGTPAPRALPLGADKEHYVR